MVIGGEPIEHGAGFEKSLVIAEEAAMMPHERGRGGKRTKHLHLHYITFTFTLH